MGCSAAGSGPQRPGRRTPQNEEVAQTLHFVGCRPPVAAEANSQNDEFEGQTFHCCGVRLPAVPRSREPNPPNMKSLRLKLFIFWRFGLRRCPAEAGEANSPQMQSLSLKLFVFGGPSPGAEAGEANTPKMKRLFKCRAVEANTHSRTPNSHRPQAKAPK